MDVVYFVQRNDDCIKIGFTGNFPGRMRTLITEHGPLELLGLEPGTFRREQEIHALFQQWRREGEWFTSSPQLQAYVKSLKGQCMEIALTFPHRTNIAAASNPSKPVLPHPGERDKVRELLSPFDGESWMLQLSNLPVPQLADNTWEARRQLLVAVKSYAARVVQADVEEHDAAVFDLAYLCAALVAEQAKGQGPGAISYLSRIGLVGLLEVWRTIGHADPSELKRRLHKRADSVLEEFCKTRPGLPVDWGEEVYREKVEHNFDFDFD